MKLRSSTKIAIGFVAVVAILFGGYRTITSRMIANLDLPPVVPGVVNLVGIDAGLGYSIIVANQMAQLVESDGGFENPGGAEGGAESGAIKKRIPVREMLGALQGDQEALSRFVMLMNDIRENEKWPTVHVMWTMERLEEAFESDGPARQELERDLNVRIDGTPLPSLRPSSLANGIIIDFPVEMKVNVGGEMRTLIARVKQPYKPRLMSTVEQQLQDKRVTTDMQAGTYATEARIVMDDPEMRERVSETIRSVYSAGNQQYLAKAPSRLLESAEVIINEGHITKASYRGYDVSDGKRYDLSVDLTDEGRKRLWKYSINEVGSQILLLVDGIAIAAPRIQHPLTQSQLSIKGLPDEVLVSDAADAMNKSRRSE
jgi:hypothetical protein